MRQRKGLTLREVADAAQVSLAHLSDVERGEKEASSAWLDAVCGALGVAVVVGLRVRGQYETGADFIPHGTPNGYSNYRCRCPECRKGQGDYYREWRRKRRQRARESAA